MLENIRKENILFLDIETVPLTENMNQLDEPFQKLWLQKVDALKKSNKVSDDADAYFRSAGIYAEFGRIICISVGALINGKLRLKSFFGHDEKKLLKEFADLLNKHYSGPDYYLCAHNGKEFDFPYLSRRMLINEIPLPKALSLHGKKPWEITHLDTMELWKFGDYKSYTSLNLLANVLGIPTPKDDIDGSMVYDVYWKEKNLERIVTYCQKDVLTIVQVLLKLKGEKLISQHDIEVA
jgi:uncharacterized protein YprB with RNaseH-like and TPR domain